jgi:predicted methyltransferase
MSQTIRTLALAGLAAAALAAAGGAALAHNHGSHRHSHAATQPAERMTIAQAVAGEWRAAGDKARDGARHPAETLAFWQLRPGMRVVEVGPGGGYWTDILAPYLAANGGTLIPTFRDPELATPAQLASRERFLAEYAANPALFGTLQPGVLDAASTKPIAEPGSVDLIISSRNFHGFYLFNTKDFTLRAWFAALKPGGYVGIEQHRGLATQANNPSSGYVRQDVVIAEMARAGFQFVGSSEINANPRDTKNHPFGVWTLPPTRRSAPQGQPDNPGFDHAPYDAIGESDRMTLLFRKPAS